MNLKACLAATFTFLAASTSAHAASLTIMNGSHNILTFEGGIGAYGHTTSLLSDNAAGWSTATSGTDVIITEENGVDGANTAAVQSFLNAGGRVIVMGGYGTNEISFVNAVLGTSLTSTGGSAGPNYNQTAAAVGTTFADDPAVLRGLNSYHDATGTLAANSTVFYEEANGDYAVFRTAYGAGDLFYLGYDYCCGGSAAERTAWMDVLDSAIRYDGTITAPVPLPASLPLLLAGLGGVAALRRRRG
ncbi:VPLPA-CTERM sorting domain-containing protein [Primorskyibacter sp. S187A]|uniref:VPLPA-CTERM sorting domain-containing protein n=1 Tax=Primorskyibacter sp. S187A TaxID=3415130 RepID=UPI003C7B620D